MPVPSLRVLAHSTVRVAQFVLTRRDLMVRDVFVTYAKQRHSLTFAEMRLNGNHGRHAVSLFVCMCELKHLNLWVNPEHYTLRGCGNLSTVDEG